MEGVGEDDDGVAGFDEITLAEEGESRADVGFGITFFEGHLDGLNAAGESEDATDVQVRGEGEDGGEFGALVGEEVGHDAPESESDEFGTGNGVGEDDGGFGGFVFVGFEGGVGGKTAGGVALLDAAGDGIEDFDAFVGVLADAGFAAEHDAVDLFDDGVKDVGDFGPGRDGILDHAFEHLGGDDDFSTVVGASFNDVALDDGEVFNGAFAAEVAAGDHDAA